MMIHEKRSKQIRDRGLVEALFIQGQVNHLLNVNSTKNDVLNTKKTIAKCAVHRVNLVCSVLEKYLNERACRFYTRGRENLGENSYSSEELILIIDVIRDCVLSYKSNHIQHQSGINSQELTKNTCGLLISTIGGIVFVQIQYLPQDISKKLHESCGFAISVLSELNQDATLFHISQILKKCLDPTAESKGTFYSLQCLQYLKLKKESMLALFHLVAEVVTPPGGLWKKSAMMEICPALRMCIFHWIEHDMAGLRSLFSSTVPPVSDETSIASLLGKLEPWATGAKKRSCVYPLLSVLIALLPASVRQFQGLDPRKATSVFSTNSLSVESRILKKTVENLMRSSMQVVMQKDSQLFTELSVISVVHMARVAATSARAALVDQHALHLSQGRSQSQSSPASASSREIFDLVSFVESHMDKVQEHLFQGNCPSAAFFSAISIPPYGHIQQSTSSPQSGGEAVAYRSEDISPDSLLRDFLWSLFYLNKTKCLVTLTRILSSSSVAPVVKTGAIQAITRILQCDKVDRIGKMPTWSQLEAVPVRTKVLSVFGKFRMSYLSSRGMTDVERGLICNIEMQNGGTSQQQQAAAAHEGFSLSAVDVECLVEILRLVSSNPWFVFIRGVIDESTKNAILTTASTVSLALLMHDIASMLELEYPFEKIALGAADALISLLESKHMSLWTPKDPICGVLSITGILMNCIACQLLRCTAFDGVRTQTLLKCMLCALTNVNEHLQDESLLCQESLLNEQLTCMLRVVTSTIEAALLVHCCSGNIEVVNQTILCLSALCSYRARVDDMEDAGVSSVPFDVWPIYREISNVAVPIISLKLHQAMIRSLLSKLSESNLGMSWALSVVVQRWFNFNKLIFRPDAANSFPSKNFLAFDEWSNQMGFLCALGSFRRRFNYELSDELLAPFLTAVNVEAEQGSGSVEYESDLHESLHSADIGAAPSFSARRSATPTLLADTDVGFSNSNLALLETSFVQSLLHLILLQHEDKHVGQEAFMAVGTFLNAKLIPQLFHELYIVLGVLIEVLTKRCDAGTTLPTALEKVTQSHSMLSSNYRAFTLNDFDIFIASMTLGQILGFLNAALTMLQMIFDREWRVSRTARVKDRAEAEDGMDGMDGVDGMTSETLVEKIFQRLINIVTKMQTQLDLDELRKYNTSGKGTASSGASNTNVVAVTLAAVRPNEHFHIKKKMAHLLETFMNNRGKIKNTKTFQMKVLSYLMDWAYDCVNQLNLNTSYSFGPPPPLFSQTSSMLASGRSALLKNPVEYGAPPFPMSPATAELNKESRLQRRGFETSSSSSTPFAYNSDAIELFKQTKLTSVKAIAVFLDGLEISADAEDESLPAPKSGGGKNLNITDLRSKIFYRYFHVLQSILISCVLDSYSSSFKTALEKATVTALCNLLHSNTGIGMRHMVDAACTHEQQGVRALLLKVFTEILSRRVDFSFGFDNKQPSYEDALQELRVMLLAPNRALAKILCTTTRGDEAELICRSLLAVFEGRNSSMTLQLLHWAISAEILATSRLGSLFRSESMGTKLMGAFFAQCGREYLHAVLDQPMQKYFLDSPDLEVDSHKGVQEAKVPENTERLKAFTELFLFAILKSVPRCPPGIRYVLEVLREGTKRHFAGQEECERVAVAGYMFLRFFCPAIALPVKYGFVPNNDQTALSKNCVRGLLLIAKILQNLANGTHFLESCMEPFNSWIDGHTNSLLRFCYSISGANKKNSLTPNSDTAHAVAVVAETFEGAEESPVVVEAVNVDVVDDEDVGDVETEMEMAADDTEEISSTSSEESVESDVHIGSGEGQFVESGMGDIEDDGQSMVLSETAMEGLIEIHRFLFAHKDRIERMVQAVSSSSPPQDADSQISSDDMSKRMPSASSLLPSEFAAIRESFPALLIKLGEPPEPPPKAAEEKQTLLRQKSVKSTNLSTASEEYLLAIEKRPQFNKLIEKTREKMIFYLAVPPSSSPTALPAFIFVCKRVDHEMDYAVMIYIILKEMSPVVKAGKQFDLVIDSSLFNTEAELVKWSYTHFWGKLKSLLGDATFKLNRKIYVLYPSIVLVMAARKLLKRSGLKTRAIMDKVEFCTPSTLGTISAHAFERLPQSTVAIEAGILKKWNATLQKRAVVVTLSGQMLLIQTQDNFGGIDYTRTDILSLLLIDSISAAMMSSSSKAGVSQTELIRKRLTRSSKDQNVSQPPAYEAVLITYTTSQTTRSIKLQCGNTKQFLAALSVALTNVRQQRVLEEASKWAGTRLVHPDAILGMLLQVCFLNLFSDTLDTRRASYVLLSQLHETYHLPLASFLPVTHSEITSLLFLPSNLVQFAVMINSELVIANPDCGKEFIFESFQTLNQITTTQYQKVALIMYLQPWLILIEQFYESLAKSYLPTSNTILLDNLEINGAADVLIEPHVNPTADSSANSNLMSTPFKEVKEDIPKTRSHSLLTPSMPFTAHPRRSSLHHDVDTTNPPLRQPNGSYRLDKIPVEELNNMLDDVFEIAIVASSKDNALGLMISFDFWTPISRMPNVLSRAVKYFVSRWMSESLVKCLKSDTSTAVRSSLLRGKSKGAVDDAASGTAPAPAQDAYFLQTQCSYCITMCEVLSVLGRMEPVMIWGTIFVRFLKLLAKLIAPRGDYEMKFFTSKQTCYDMAEKLEAVTDANVADGNVYRADASQVLGLSSNIDDGTLLESSQINGIAAQSGDSDASDEDENAVGDVADETDMSILHSSPTAVEGPPRQILFENKLAEFGLLESTPQKIKISHKADGLSKKAGNDTPFQSNQLAVAYNPTPVDTPVVTPIKSRKSLLKLKPDSSVRIWDEVGSLIRPSQHLIFNNYKLYINKTPEIIHVILILISQQAPLYLRHGIQELLASLIHGLVSFATAIASTDEYNSDISMFCGEAAISNSPVGCWISEETVASWKAVLSQISEPSPSQFHMIFNEVQVMTQNNIDIIVSAISSLVSTSITAKSPLCAVWRKTLWKLTLNSAIRTLPHVSSSTFFLCLSSFMEKENINPDVLWELFTSLDYVLELYASQKCGDIEKLIDPVLKCICKIIPFLAKGQIFRLFWLSLLLIQVFPSSMLLGPMSLLNAIVQELLYYCDEMSSLHVEDGGSIEKQAETDSQQPTRSSRSFYFLENALLQARVDDVQLGEILNRVDSAMELHLSFQSSFSSALSKLLLRGLFLTETRGVVVDLLNKLNKHSRQADVFSGRCRVSGYSVLLFPLVRDDKIESIGANNNPALSPSLQHQEAFAFPSVVAKLPREFFGEKNFPTVKDSVLFVANILSYLKEAQEHNAECHVMLVLLLQTIREIPSVLGSLSDVIFNQLMECFSLGGKQMSGASEVVRSAAFDVLNECMISASLGEVNSAFSLSNTDKVDLNHTLTEETESVGVTSLDSSQERAANRTRLVAFLNKTRSKITKRYVNCAPTNSGKMESAEVWSGSGTSASKRGHHASTVSEALSGGMLLLHEFGLSALLECIETVSLKTCSCGLDNGPHYASWHADSATSSDASIAIYCSTCKLPTSTESPVAAFGLASCEILRWILCNLDDEI